MQHLLLQGFNLVKRWQVDLCLYDAVNLLRLCALQLLWVHKIHDITVCIQNIFDAKQYYHYSNPCKSCRLNVKICPVSTNVSAKFNNLNNNFNNQNGINSCISRRFESPWERERGISDSQTREREDKTHFCWSDYVIVTWDTSGVPNIQKKMQK